MLVQELDGHFRLIRQQDHAQLSGLLAHAWRGPARHGAADPDGPRTGAAGHGGLPYRVAWAAGAHDAAWSELDARPLLDPSTGRPFDFHRLPLSRKLGPYRRGIDRVAELDPYAGFQVSRHYSSFLDGEEAGDFLEAERERRRGLRRQLPPSLRDDDLLERELGYLKLFDTLSLFLCLAAPGLHETSRPPWLVPDDRLEAPDGSELALRWAGEASLAAEPSPFPSGVEAEVPCRLVPRPVGSQEALERAWREAEPRHWSVRVEPGG